jgi:hypothetical protein
MGLKLFAAGVILATLLHAGMISVSTSAGATACNQAPGNLQCTSMNVVPSPVGESSASAAAPLLPGSSQDVVYNLHLLAAFGDLAGNADLSYATSSYEEDHEARIEFEGGGAGSAFFSDTLGVGISPNGGKVGDPTSIQMVETLTYTTLNDNLSAGFIISTSYSFDDVVMNAGSCQSATAGDLTTYNCLGIVILGAVEGSTYDISESLNLGITTSFQESGEGSLDSDSSSGFSEIVAMNSAHLYLDSLTPGVTLTSGSGHDYSSTPEPGTKIMVLVGLLYVLGLSKRGRLTSSRYPDGRA